MSVEVELSPAITTGEMLGLAKMVDEAGADRLEISDVATLATRNGLSSAAKARAMIGECHRDPVARGD